MVTRTLTLFLLFLIMKGKDYYVVPIYPMMLAGGAVAIEGWTSRLGSPWRRFARAAAICLVAATGALLAPAVLPLLSPEDYVAYTRAMHLAPSKTEVNHVGPLPQVWGDQFGWPEMVQQVASVYDALSPDERARTGILTGNYGEAGAIDLLGPKYGLPQAMSGHQTYYFWGTQGFTGDQVITLQYGPRYLGKICDQYREVANHFHEWGMAEENHAIYLCHLKQPLSAIWEDQKHWN
ncbi:MAG: hypothetical protein H0X25_00450 [Acidobacteriales bacterium]|nr:hypothetical protein [Terriglobales bacterium]